MLATHGRAAVLHIIDRSAPPPGARSDRALGRYLTARNFGNVLGLAILFWCATYWYAAVGKWRAPRSPVTWYQPYSFLSLDFLHNYQASRFWLEGHDPYQSAFGDPIGRKLCYPPIVLVCFAWCKLLAVKTAVAVWTFALGLLAAFGAWAAWDARRRLGLAPVPAFLVIAAVVTSSPVGFALERGNYDLLIVPLAVMAAWGLRHAGRFPDVVVGYSLGLAICLKVYPGLLLVAPMALGRWRAIGMTGAAIAILMTFQHHNLPIFVENLAEMARQHESATLPVPTAMSHSIPYNWFATWSGTKLDLLTTVPGSVATAVIIGGLLAWVGRALYRCRDPRPVLLPFLFWTLAAATFVPKVSNDYNLVFLPMAMLAVWDRRDPVYLHAGLGVLCLILQPIAFPMSGSVIFGIKLAGLALLANGLVNRFHEQMTPNHFDAHATRATEGQHAS